MATHVCEDDGQQQSDDGQHQRADGRKRSDDCYRQVAENEDEKQDVTGPGQGEADDDGRAPSSDRQELAIQSQNPHGADDKVTGVEEEKDKKSGFRSWWPYRQRLQNIKLLPIGSNDDIFHILKRLSSKLYHVGEDVRETSLLIVQYKPKIFGPKTSCSHYVRPCIL
jgi:hypothetical protein